MIRTYKTCCRKAIVAVGLAGVCLAVCGWTVSGGAAETNLLENGGFERGAGDSVLGWTASVAPGVDAYSLWDGEVSHGGLRSVKLCTETPYPGEPFNNWYQNIEAPLDGKKIKLSGYIKGHEVQDAALWLQCFQRGSSVPVAVGTSHTNKSPVGDFGWTQQMVEVDVPQGTTLVVVRLMFVGTGTVWFDDVALDVSESKSSDAIRPIFRPEDGLASKLDAIAEENKSLRENYEKLTAKLDQLASDIGSLRESIEGKAKDAAAQSSRPAPFLIPDRSKVRKPVTDGDPSR
jgi:hypothetical protein